MSQMDKLYYMQKILIILESRESEFLKKLYNTLLRNLALFRILGRPDALEYGNIITIGNLISKRIGLPEGFYHLRTKKRIIAQWRQVMHTIFYDNSTISLEKIGSHIGGKDHSTVIHSHKVVDNLYDTDKRFRYLYEGIINELGVKYKKYGKSQLRF